MRAATNPRILRMIPVLIVVRFLCLVQSAFAGSIVGWGDDVYGQATAPTSHDFVAVAAGYEHSLALKSDGSIVGWGRDHYSQAAPPIGSDFIAIAAGGNRSLALRKGPCQYVLAGDLNDDCGVNTADLAIMAASWLIDCELDPTDPACVPK